MPTQADVRKALSLDLIVEPVLGDLKEVTDLVRRHQVGIHPDTYAITGGGLGLHIRAREPHPRRDRGARVLLVFVTSHEETVPTTLTSYLTKRLRSVAMLSRLPLR